MALIHRFPTPGRLARAWRSCAALVVALMSLPVSAQYPDKPVHIIVGLQAGASTDALARQIGKRLGDTLGQPFIVDNKPGAATRIGMTALVHAPGDGYTLAVANAVSTSFPLMFDNFAFVPGKDFVPITMLGRAPSYLAVRSTLPVKDAREFAAYAKAHGGKLSYGYGGIGSNPHFAALTLLRSLGVTGVGVAYKGNAPTAIGLAGNEIDFAMLDYASVRPLAESGRVRLLAVTEPKRTELTPDVPTSGEQGLSRELDGMTPWFMLIAPTGTPVATTEFLQKKVDLVLKEPEVRQALHAAGIDPQISTPAQAQTYFQQERKRLETLAREMNVSLRN